MSAINAMRIILSCENGAAADAANTITRVVISDPTFFMNIVRVDPIESFDQVDYMCALASKASATGARVMKTSWFCNN